jgi:hypothetical protein
MRFEAFSFGAIRIDGVTHEHDVVIDRGHVRKRSKKPSKKYRDRNSFVLPCRANGNRSTGRRIRLPKGFGVLGSIRVSY